MDAETQALLDSLVESLPTARALLLVGYRPEYSHGWGRKTYYLQLRLDPLPPESADELLDGLLGPDASLQSLKTRLAASTGGNPLFLEESVRTLVELNALVGERGAYRLAQSIDTLQVPTTVQSILAARIDRLRPEEKRLLETAAVIGKDFAYTLLQAVTDEADAVIRARLDHLQAAEFLYETRLFPDLEYTFKHALTHDVAYGSLLHERRRALHARVVAAIERLHGDRLPEHVERLAHHAFRGEDWGRAVQWGRQAAAKALTHSAHREATAYLKQALEALARLPDGRLTGELAVDLRLDLYQSLMPLDDLRPLLQFLREAEALAVALDDQERLGWTRLYICHLLLLIDDTRAAVQLAHDVVGIAETVGNRGIEADAYLWLGCGYYALGQPRRAVELLRKGVAARRTYAGSRDVVALSRCVVMFLAELGEFAEAEAEAEITTGSALTTPDRPFSLANACWQIASFWCLKGDLDRAMSLAERAVDLSRRWSFTRSLGNQLSLYGHILALSGHATEAVDVLEQGMRRPTRSATCGFDVSACTISQRGTSSRVARTRRSGRPIRPSSSRANGRSVDSRPGLYGFWPRSPRPPRHPRRWPRRAIEKRWPWRPSWRCVLSFATTPSGNAGLRVRLGGLVARGTARCGSRKRSRHAGFAPCVRPLRTEASVRATAYPPRGDLATQRWLSDGKHWGVGAPGGTRTPGIRLRRRRPWPVPART